MNFPGEFPSKPGSTSTTHRATRQPRRQRLQVSGRGAVVVGRDNSGFGGHIAAQGPGVSGPAKDGTGVFPWFLWFFPGKMVEIAGFFPENCWNNLDFTVKNEGEKRQLCWL